jgi:hypothetical protein
LRKPPGKIQLIEELYAEGVAFLRGEKMGLFTFTMMMKRERITNSLVIEKRSFCIQYSKAYGVPHAATQRVGVFTLVWKQNPLGTEWVSRIGTEMSLSFLENCPDAGWV